MLYAIIDDIDLFIGCAYSFFFSVTPTPLIKKFYPNCQCTKDNTGFICDQSGSDPPKFQVVTGEWLQDITGAREEDFYLNTNDLYRLHRYGGFSFGLKRPFIPENFGKDGPTEFRKLGVRTVSMVCHIFILNSYIELV